MLRQVRVVADGRVVEAGGARRGLAGHVRRWRDAVMNRPYAEHHPTTIEAYRAQSLECLEVAAGGATENTASQVVV